MGDVAVGARSGHNEPEDPAGSPVGGAGDDDADVEVPGGTGGRAGSGGPDGGGGDSGPDKDDRGTRNQRAFWKELPLLIGIALVLALLIKTFLVQAFSIPSESMQDTLLVGDRVLVDKLTPWFGAEPERGEVVVFHDPGGWLEGEPTPTPNVAQKFLSFIGLMPSANEKDLIKRVIAIGGDTVECKRGGPVMVNGKALSEKSYIYPGSTPCNDQPFGPINVPKGRIWVMGDNRQDSLDSRYHQNLQGSGTVSVNEVVGRAFTVIWPVNRWSWMGLPGTFGQPGINTAAAVGPGALGFAGALPIVLCRRRRLSRKRTAG